MHKGAHTMRTQTHAFCVQSHVYAKATTSFTVKCVLFAKTNYATVTTFFIIKTVQAVFIKFAVKIVCLKVYVMFASTVQ